VLIHTYQALPRREVLDCRVMALEELLRHYGQGMSPYLVMLLAESYGFRYGTMDFEGSTIRGVPYAVASDAHLDRTLFGALQADYAEEVIDDSAYGWDRMKDLLNKDIPIITRLDARMMLHSESYVPDSTLAKIYYVSELLLVGYSEDEKEVFLVPADTSDDAVALRVPFDVFQAHRNTVCLPYSPGFSCSYLVGPSPFVVLNDRLLSRKLRESLQHTCDKMLTVRQPETVDIPGFGMSSINTGIPAMKMLGDHLRSLASEFSDNGEQVSARKYLLFSLLFLRNSLMVSTRSAFRGEFGEGLIRCSELASNKYLADIGQRMNEVARVWQRWFARISMLPHNAEGFGASIHHLCDTYDSLVESEEAALKDLREKLY